MMTRVLEPELMDDQAQVLAYAGADFDKENQEFVDRFRRSFPELGSGHILDLGCGPGDIPIRLLRAFPYCRVTGIDGAVHMIEYATQAVQKAGMEGSIDFQCVSLQNLKLREPSDYGISNSLLHHLPNPLIFWVGLKQWVNTGGGVFVMDLLRPDNPSMARGLVEQYASGESPILQRDFFNSLLAAFTIEEITEQLLEAQLDQFKIEIIDDRHWIVHGRI